MKDYIFKNKYNKLLTPNIVAMLSQIHEFKGQLSRLTNVKSDALTELTKIAKIHSTESSNKIEGIITTDDRLKKIVREKTMPKNRSEQEIAGYRDALSIIHENYEYIPPKPSLILQLHRDLYKYSGQTIGGHYKTSDNIIAEDYSDGTRYVRFTPVPSWETPEALQHLCDEYSIALAVPEMDPLILIAIFILDFLCIHPFNDGNGRMSRLLTLLLLYRAGYTVGKYISIEKLISDSKETYYEVLQEGSLGWHENENNYLPFVRYLLGIIVAAYREFALRVELLTNQSVSKPDRIRKVIKNSLNRMTKSEIMKKCPDISQITVQRTLKELVDSGDIIKVGGGRYTSYIWNREK